ncbi:protein elav-like [Mytilus edulis]|uniref:protein elav-like n=1 Tax=Mytilus edulis TaxID=6550 RepID=UPI0039EE8123
MRQLGIQLRIPILPNLQLHNQHQLLNQRHLLPIPPAANQNRPAHQQVHINLPVPQNLPAINQGPIMNQNQQVPHNLQHNLPIPAINQEPIMNQNQQVQIVQNPMPAINQQPPIGQQMRNQNQQVGIIQNPNEQVHQNPEQNRNIPNHDVNANERGLVIQNPNNLQQLRRSNRVRKQTVRYGFE